MSVAGSLTKLTMVSFDTVAMVWVKEMTVVTKCPPRLLAAVAVTYDSLAVMVTLNHGVEGVALDSASWTNPRMMTMTSNSVIMAKTGAGK